MKKFETAVFQEIVDCTYWNDLNGASIEEKIEWFNIPDELLNRFKEAGILKGEYELVSLPYELLGELGYEFKSTYTVTIKKFKASDDYVRNKIVTTIIAQREI